MKGSFDICVKNARIQYKFTLYRNITLLQGDSATGKTTLIEMLASYQTNGLGSGITVECKKRCVVLTAFQWQLNLQAISDSIVFIDEGEGFVASREFAEAVKASDNYYVIASRRKLDNLPYSIQEIYGIKNKSANRYQGTKRLYSEFYPLYKNDTKIRLPSLVIVEDSNAGFQFFRHYFEKIHVECVSAGGKSNIYGKIIALNRDKSQPILVIADGAAFGCEMESIVKLKSIRDLIIYLPESFEWLILKSGLFSGNEIKSVLEKPFDSIESKAYFSWEQFFTKVLLDISKDSYLQYSKKEINPCYLQDSELRKIIDVMPPIENG